MESGEVLRFWPEESDIGRAEGCGNLSSNDVAIFRIFVDFFELNDEFKDPTEAKEERDDADGDRDDEDDTCDVDEERCEDDEEPGDDGEGPKATVVSSNTVALAGLFITGTAKGGFGFEITVAALCFRVDLLAWILAGYTRRGESVDIGLLTNEATERVWLACLRTTT